MKMKWRACPDENETSAPDAARLYRAVFLLHVPAHCIHDRIQLQPVQGLFALHRLYPQVVLQPAAQLLHPACAAGLAGSGSDLCGHCHCAGYSGKSGHCVHGPQEPPCRHQHHLYPGGQPGDHHRHLAHAAVRGLPALCRGCLLAAGYHHGLPDAAHCAYRVQCAVCHLQRHAQAQAIGYQAV